MRVFGPFILAALATGCVETGAHLTLVAPEEPAGAASFSVVLAAHDMTPTIGGQRVQLGARNTHEVTYYLQRTVAGGTSDIGPVDGATIRVAPEGAITDTTFIPFVIISDGDGAIVGIGTYDGGDGRPAPIHVQSEQVDKYTISIEAVTQVDPTRGPDTPERAGQVEVIECVRDGEELTSGLVWRPRRGGEVRILFPDDGGTDATGRALDLDCDDHAVTPDDSGPDCDDTRDWFHRDAAELCDGEDTNCDDQEVIALPCESNVCDLTSTNVQTGVELCDDTLGTSLGCSATATCACSAQQGCRTCYVPHAAGENAGATKPCQPAFGTVGVEALCEQSAPCTIDVVGVRDGWIVEISPSGIDAFGSRAEGVIGHFRIKAKRPEGGNYELVPDIVGHLADVDFAVTTAMGIRYLGLRLALIGDHQAACPEMPTMICEP